MNTIKSICAITGVLLASAIPVFAIEGLKISVQSSNVVLSWPSMSNETYIVQYRQTLNSTDTWGTLTNYVPAAIGTNLTFFVHSNIVQYPDGGLGSGGTNDGGNISPPEPEMMSGSGTMSDSTATLAPPAVPMAMPANGSGDAVPLAIYPPGFDLSGFVIFDPATGEWVSGAGFSVGFASSAKTDSIQPLDDSSGGGNSVSDPGFYRVVRDGAHIYGLTNGMVLSGEVQFPIEFAVDSTDEIVGVTFYDENNSPIIGASALANAGGRWILDWNTPMSFNGDYNIYAELDFASNDPVVSAPVTVTVNNTISFPNYFSRVFGDQMWIYAQTIPDAAYEIDMYDENTNYLGSFLDNADDGGYISFLWDLTDGNGNTFDSTNFYGVFTVDTSSLSSLSKAQVKNLNTNSPSFQTLSLTNKMFGSHVTPNDVHPNGGSSSASANQLWVKEPVWTPNNNWVVAYADLTGDPTVDGTVQEMIVGGASSPTEDYGVLGTLDPEGLNGNLSPGNNAQGGNVFALHDPTTRSDLLSYLADHRYENFYYFGHGNETSISAYHGSGSVIANYDITYALLNVPLSWSIIHAAYHPYRFVWIEACDTGKANFCESFGIPAITVSTNFFAAAGVESRAYLGFKKPVSYDSSNSSGDVNAWPSRSTMIGDFLSPLIHNQADLQTLMYLAQSGQLANYPIYQMDQSAVIYGAYDLTWNIRTRP